MQYRCMYQCVIQHAECDGILYQAKWVLQHVNLLSGVSQPEHSIKYKWAILEYQADQVTLYTATSYVAFKAP